MFRLTNINLPIPTENRFLKLNAGQNYQPHGITCILVRSDPMYESIQYAETPLNKACYHGKLGPVFTLVKVGAEIDKGDMVRLYSPK